MPRKKAQKKTQNKSKKGLCEFCGKNVIYLGAYYCSPKCWSEMMKFKTKAKKNDSSKVS